MTWKIEWHPNAFKELESLPKYIRERIIKRIDKVKENPFHFLEHFERKGFYKLRIGDYRAIASVDFENKIIKMHIFDHGGRIYKSI